MAAFHKEEIFPKIAQVIDQYLLSHSSIHRDQIVEILVQVHPELIQQAAQTFKNPNPTNVAGNMVDWFSAELSKKSLIVAPWQGRYIKTPEKIKGRIISVYSFSEQIPLEECWDPTEMENFKEGMLKNVLVNSYERNTKARAKCLEIHGYSCSCCNFNFLQSYGDIGIEFIHVHHKTPISNIKQEYRLNPETDLVPVCPNCHAMIHRRNPPFSIEEIQQLLQHNARKNC